MIPDSRAKYLKQFYTENKKVKLSDILAICDKESTGIEYFTSADKLFWQNLRAAEQITGVSRKEILEMTLISKPHNKFNSFLFDKFGFAFNADPAKYIKFRCEPSIYKLVKNMKEFTPKERFLLACSVGVGQRLLYYWLANSKKPKSTWIKSSKAFAVDLNEQLKEIVVNMSWWFLKAKGNRELGFSYYNSGGGIKQPTAYGIAVENLSKQYLKYD